MNERPSSLRNDADTAFLLMCLCARSSMGADAREQAEELILAGIDWPRLMRLAYSHRVAGLLLANFRSESVTGVPAAVIAGLEKSEHLRKVRTVFLVAELTRLTSLLQGDGIQSMAFKGPVIARVAYGSDDLRGFSDLDILIDPGKFPDTRKLLLANGYEPFSKLAGLSERGEKLFLWQSRQYQFKRANGMFNLDLHLEIMPPLYRFPLDFGSLYRERLELKVGSGAVSTFSHTHMLLVLCFHCIKNRWEQLKHVADIAEHVGRNQTSIDWDLLTQIAVKARCRNIVHLSLRLATLLLDAPVPVHVSDALHSRRIDRLADQAVREFRVGRNLTLTPFLTRLRENLVIQDTIAQKLRYIGGALVRRAADLTARSSLIQN